MVMYIQNRFYLFELKLNRSASVAMSQINLKRYQDKFELAGAPVAKIAINFSLEERTITDWVISPDVK
ncbi:MAG: PD-(D/E)XK nuclease domain-containing protein [Bacteroidia bacterium]|nr:PD-(D/E)XK nuclease domain-containing protein [Bacteroidia bacterium]